MVGDIKSERWARSFRNGGRHRAESADGHIEVANREEPLTEGAFVALALRPERIRVMPAGAARNGRNSLRGSVSEIVYLGQSRKLVVKTDAGSQLVALEQLGADRVRLPAIGERVQLEWELGDAVVLSQ
jgi:putative spermidine/putrescine transport system ATP-binding protein